MDLAVIYEFLALAETLSYHEAARRTGVSVPVLTRHIQKLEAELGAPLLNRTTRRVMLNKLGQVFLPYAQMLAHTDSECRKMLEQYHNQSSNRLCIGAMSISSSYGVTDVIADFREEHPECVLDVVEADSDELMLMLETGNCDLIFARDDSAHGEKLRRIPYVTDHLSVLLPLSHPLAGEKSVRLEQLHDCNFLTFPVDTYMHARCVRLCRAAGFEPNIVFSIFGEHNLMKLVEAGLGISLLLNRPAVLHNNPNIAIIDLEPAVISKINIMYRRDAELSEMTQVFLDYVSQRLQQ